jgi:ADP-ribose pyrophosphatase YjhB (NUDIX family)
MARLPASYCPQCGAALTSRQFEGRERTYCRDCDRFVWRDAVPVADVVVHEAGRVLFVERAIPPGRGTWGLPSGFLEHDEDPRAGAVRELAEETELRAAPEDLTIEEAVVSPSAGDRWACHVVYAVPLADTGGTPAAGDETSAVRLWSRAELAAADAVTLFESDDEFSAPIRVAFRVADAASETDPA